MTSKDKHTRYMTYMLDKYFSGYGGKGAGLLRHNQQRYVKESIWWVQKNRCVMMGEGVVGYDIRDALG